MTRARSFLFGSLFAAGAATSGLVLAACGGAGEAKAPSKAGAPADEREPSSIAEAQEQIDRARADLGLDLGAKKTESADAEKDDKPPPAASKKQPTEESSSVREERAAGGADACGGPCRALSSMRRAVTALCRMTGEEDARCSDAKKTLTESESRVARCHCPS